MKDGKVSDTVLRRSILKNVYEVNNGKNAPKVGGGAATMMLCREASADGGLSRATKLPSELIVSTQTVVGEGMLTSYLAAVRGELSLAAKRARAESVSFAITVPNSMEERDLRQMQELCGEHLKKNGIQILGGHTTVSSAVTEPVVSVSVLGRKEQPEEKTEERAEFINKDIVMTKYCGMTGTALLVKRQKEALTKRFPKNFVERAEALLQSAEEKEEAFLASPTDVCYIHAAAEGGVFGALWELAEFTGCGLSVSLPSIPIRQETVEICEYFDCNPYQLLTTGSFLMLSDNGGALVSELLQNGVHAAVIGRTKEGPNREVKTGEEVRYLEPNRTEEYERIRSKIK